MRYDKKSNDLQLKVVASYFPPPRPCFRFSPLDIPPPILYDSPKSYTDVRLPAAFRKKLRRGHLQGFFHFSKNNLGQRLSPLSPRRKAGDPVTENKQDKQELFQIGEVCKAMGLSRRILLNYEELGLLTPAMRREDKGFRYYSADNLAHIRVIRNLQELGLSLSAIRSYFGDTGQLEDQIQHLVDLRNRLDQYIAQLRMRQGEATDPEVCMVTLPAFTAYCRDFSGADLQAKTALLRQTYIDAAHSYSLDFHSRMCTQLSIRNPDSGTFIIPVSPESQGPCIRKFDQTSALSLFFRGAYEEFPPLHARLLAYAEAHGMTPHGYFRNIYIEGPPTHGSNKAAYASQLTLPIKFMDV